MNKKGITPEKKKENTKTRSTGHGSKQIISKSQLLTTQFQQYFESNNTPTNKDKILMIPSKQP